MAYFVLQHAVRQGRRQRHAPAARTSINTCMMMGGELRVACHTHARLQHTRARARATRPSFIAVTYSQTHPMRMKRVLQQCITSQYYITRRKQQYLSIPLTRTAPSQGDYLYCCTNIIRSTTLITVIVYYCCTTNYYYATTTTTINIRCTVLIVLLCKIRSILLHPRQPGRGSIMIILL